MNKTEYLNHLNTIYDRVGVPRLAKDDPIDVARRQELGQTWYSVAVTTNADDNGNPVSKTAAHFFYVYDEGEDGEAAFSAEKAPAPLITPPETPSTFLEEAIAWYKANRGDVIKFAVNESAPEIEIVRFRVMALDANNEMDEWMVVVWREDGVFHQAKYTGTYNV